MKHNAMQCNAMQGSRLLTKPVDAAATKTQLSFLSPSSESCETQTVQ